MRVLWYLLKFLIVCGNVLKFRNIPLGITISMAIITGVYVLANLAYFVELPVVELLSTDAVALVSSSDICSCSLACMNRPDMYTCIIIYILYNVHLGFKESKHIRRGSFAQIANTVRPALMSWWFFSVDLWWACSWSLVVGHLIGCRSVLHRIN